MQVIDLIQYLSGRVPLQYYPNKFPAKSADDCVVVKLTGGGAADKYTIGVKSPSFQILVRAKHPNTAEENAQKLFGLLHGTTFFNVGETFIASCMSNQSEPTYIGDDENGRPIYSLNFSCVTKG